MRSSHASSESRNDATMITIDTVRLTLATIAARLTRHLSRRAAQLRDREPRRGRARARQQRQRDDRESRHQHQRADSSSAIAA